MQLPAGAELCSAPNIFLGSKFGRTAIAALEGPSETPLICGVLGGVLCKLCKKRKIPKTSRKKPQNLILLFLL